MINKIFTVILICCFLSFVITPTVISYVKSI